MNALAKAPLFCLHTEDPDPSDEEGGQSAQPLPPTLRPQPLWREAVFVGRRYPLSWACLGRESPSCAVVSRTAPRAPWGTPRRLWFTWDKDAALSTATSPLFFLEHEAITREGKGNAVLLSPLET